MALITDLRHFLNEDGSMGDMPSHARVLAKYCGRIVRAVTSRRMATVDTGIKCRKRPSRKPCPGEIIAFIDERRTVSWSCPVCKDNGIISGWEGTMWDWSVNT